ncbi:MAG: diacylglycerol kinase family lipid kinase [Lachnospiraceae bacterium]
MYTFIINPNSRSGQGRKIWHRIEPVLQKKGTIYQSFFTKFQGHATTFIRDLTGDGLYHTIVILGGDGTVNEVINGITNYEKVTIGYIPTGSSNDFARSLKLPTDPMKALDYILAPSHIKLMDIGIISYGNKQRKFAVSTGIGFDADICHKAVVSKLKIWLNHLKMGKLTYVGIALNRLFYCQPEPMFLTLDNTQPISFEKGYFIAVMNHPYEGGGFAFCPKADPSDRQLDVIVISDMPKLKMLLLLPTAFWGKHVLFKGVHTYRCTTATVQTTHALPVHTDGEPVFLQNTIHVNCNPTQLHVITYN